MCVCVCVCVQLVFENRRYPSTNCTRIAQKYDGNKNNTIKTINSPQELEGSLNSRINYLHKREIPCQ